MEYEDISYTRLLQDIYNLGTGFFNIGLKGKRVAVIGKNRYEYRLSLRDPDEMIPWIRSFGERARVISSGRKQTERKLAEDWKKALEKYDSL